MYISVTGYEMLCFGLPLYPEYIICLLQKMVLNEQDAQFIHYIEGINKLAVGFKSGYINLYTLPIKGGEFTCLYAHK
ncbi:hypothetical protein MXB_1890 [Myxobolus squamalis]|nr:hypothetical protein MXB_1890 [Myxobolus squamalis]